MSWAFGKKMKFSVVLIFIIAFSLRLAIVLMQPKDKAMPSGDAVEYDNIASSIASGHGYSRIINNQRVHTSIRTPAYPLFLASVYALFGHSYFTIKLIQAALGSLLCIIIFFIAFKMYNIPVAFISGLIAATYKPFISGFNYYGGPASLFSEYFFMFMISISVLTLFVFLETEKALYAIITGICIGLTILTRSEFLVFTILLFLYLLHRNKFSLSTITSKYFLIFCMVAITLVPWVVRNYVVHKKFIPLSTLGGFVFWVGNQRLAEGGFAYNNDVIAKAHNLSEYDMDRYYLNSGISDLFANPARIPKLIFRKIIVHWAPFEEGKKKFNLSYAVILFLAAIGLLFFRKNGFMENIMLLLFVSTTIVAMVTFGEPRYRYAFEPYLIIFSSLTINKVFIYARDKLF